ncbi:SGNH/GDSL hydrolase family protein [Streptococcus hongkongensis]|nr:lipase [Streptococcus uberis]
MLETVSDELLAYQEERLNSFKELNKKTAPAGIVFTGDSIVEFFPLKKYLGREFPLINRGIAGTDSQWLLEHINDQVLELDPEKVFILIGTNDIGLGKTVSEIKSQILDVLIAIRSENPFIKIYLISVLPVSEKPMYQKTVKVRSNDVINQLNDELNALPGMEFIAVSQTLKSDGKGLADNYTTDGLHLTMEGYHKLSQILLDYL